MAVVTGQAPDEEDAIYMMIISYMVAGISRDLVATDVHTKCAYQGYGTGPADINYRDGDMLQEVLSHGPASC